MLIAIVNKPAVLPGIYKVIDKRAKILVDAGLVSIYIHNKHEIRINNIHVKFYPSDRIDGLTDIHADYYVVDGNESYQHMKRCGGKELPCVQDVIDILNDSVGYKYESQ